MTETILLITIFDSFPTRSHQHEVSNTRSSTAKSYRLKDMKFVFQSYSHFALNSITIWLLFVKYLRQRDIAVAWSLKKFQNISFALLVKHKTQLLIQFDYIYHGYWSTFECWTRWEFILIHKELSLEIVDSITSCNLEQFRTNWR